MLRTRLSVAALLLTAAPLGAQSPASEVDWRLSRRPNAPPAEMVVAGREENGDPLYACRVQYADGLHLGKFGPKDGFCHIGWGGRVRRLPVFELLVAARGTWGAAGAAAAPYAAGGDSVRTYSLCRARIGLGLHPGKLLARTCNVAYGDAEVAATDFEVFYLTPVGRWVTDAAGTTPTEIARLRDAGTQEDGWRAFVCRVNDDGNVYAGRLVLASRECYVAVGPNATRRSARFDLLDLPAGSWIEVQDSVTVPGALVVGIAEGRPVTLCRMSSRAGVRIGWVVPNAPGCQAGTESGDGATGSVYSPRFEVFVPRG